MRHESDKRKFERARFEEPIVIDVEEKWTALGTSCDVSLGGMFIETVDGATSIPFGARVTLHVRLAGELVVLPGVVRWTKAGGIGVQFGLLGARETHAITEALGRRTRSGTHEIEVDLDDVELAG